MHKLVPVVVVMLLAGFALELNAQPSSGEPFTRTYFSPTTLRVGYHVSIGHHVYHDDKPQGFRTCKPIADGQYTTMRGILPPGLTFDPRQQSGGIIFGTPRQPGEWLLQITFGRIGCPGGEGGVYERTVPLRIQVEP